MRVGITGHRGLSSAVEVQTRALLAEAVALYEPGELVAVSCIADGPDTWFALAVLERGGGLEVVLPAQDYRADLPEWHHSTYDELLRRAAAVHRTGLVASGAHAHMAGGELLADSVEVLIAVWDGQPARGLGGTADVVAHAERNGVPVRVLWPEGAVRD
ncbi:hypothetical protein [Streptomyces sp. NPDC002490]|uniref:hypothetical protein n=1 Tax=Streptomyces sp. NPDC002490 TaxID=3154416 RepID=UPI003318737A